MHHLEAASPGVVVGAAVRQSGRRSDGRSSTVANRGAIANDAENNVTSLPVEWLREVVDALDTIKLSGRAASNLDLNGGSISQKGAEEDGILSNRVRVNLGLALVGVIAQDTARIASAGRGETVPVLHLVLGDVKVVALVRGNVVRQEIAEAVVWHAVNVHTRASRHFAVADKRSNVAGLTKVVPCDDPVWLFR